MEGVFLCMFSLEKMQITWNIDVGGLSSQIIPVGVREGLCDGKPKCLCRFKDK
jgi:hypothetical protein